MSEPRRPTLDDIGKMLPKAERLPDAPTRRWQEDQSRELGRLNLEGLSQDLQQRRKYAGGLFITLCAWLVAILLLLFLQGFKLGGFHLTDGILVAALGTTTVNIIALFIVVAKYIFPNSH